MTERKRAPDKYRPDEDHSSEEEIDATVLLDGVPVDVTMTVVDVRNDDSGQTVTAYHFTV